MTPELARVLAALVAGVTAYEVIGVGVPEARAIGLGLLLAGLLLAWIEWRPLAGGVVEARRRAADPVAATREAADRDVARLAVLAVVIAEAGLLLALLRPIPAAPVAGDVALALAIVLVAEAIVGTLPEAEGGRGRRLARHQAWFLAGGPATALVLVIALVGALAWPDAAGTVPARAESLVAVSAAILALLPAAHAAPGSWRWPGLAILGIGAVAALAALLGWPIVTARPEIAVASVVVAAAVAMTGAALVLGTPRTPDRAPVTRRVAIRIGISLAVALALLVVVIVADWGLRHAR